jgi:hypothetical protein
MGLEHKFTILYTLQVELQFNLKVGFAYRTNPVRPQPLHGIKEDAIAGNQIA